MFYSRRCQWLRQLSSYVLLVLSLIAEQDAVQMTEIIVAEQDTLVLRCSVESDGMVWLKDNMAITQNNEYIGPDQMRISLDNRYETDFNIVIKRVLKTDLGKYECKEVTTGTILKAYEVVIKAMATIKHYSGDIVNVKEHSNARLWCNATGIPKPDVVWFMKDEQNNRISLGINGSLLEIRDVTRECVSIYTCSASNELNNGNPAEKDIRVNVRYKPDIDIDLYSGEECHNAESQIDINDSTEIALKEGETVSLVCSVSAVPKAEIKWKREDYELAYLRMDNTFEVAPLATSFKFHSCDPVYLNEQRFMLYMQADSPDHFGNFSCFAANDNGTDEWFITVNKLEN